jgi:hypothetical protein
MENLDFSRVLKYKKRSLKTRIASPLLRRLFIILDSRHDPKADHPRVSCAKVLSVDGLNTRYQAQAQHPQLIPGLYGIELPLPAASRHPAEIVEHYRWLSAAFAPSESSGS